ncbi:sigma-70 family RNA polymerase sigma factor [Stieleria sp. TO1_6]|nr:sigma-70 family RNA polymerase sigma factor [Stieleria tagensis]
MDQAIVIRVLLTERAKFLAHAWSILRDEHAAEDIFQEVMLLAVDRSDQIDSEPALIAWARTATRYRALHWIRDRKLEHLTLSEELLASLETHWEQSDDSTSEETITALRACIETMTPRSQQIVALRYGQGLSGKQVAATLDRKAQTVYMALSRIHQRLRDCVQLRLTKNI